MKPSQNPSRMKILLKIGAIFSTAVLLASALFSSVLGTFAADATPIIKFGTWMETDQYIYPRNNNKKIGIGTENPDATLEVNGNMLIDTTLKIGNSVDGSLEISGDESEAIIGTPNIGTANAGRLIFREGTKDSFTWSNNGETDKLTLKSYDTNDIMVIKRSNGYIGIGGETNPQEKLSVDGVIEAQGGIKYPDGTVQVTAYQEIPAKLFTSDEVNNLKADKLASGSKPWDAKMSLSGGTFTGQVNFPQSGVWNSLGRVGIGEPNPAQALVVNGFIETYNGIKYPDGTIQTTAYGVIPAQNFTESEVNNLKGAKLANGTTPWTSNMPLSGGTFSGSVQFSGSGIWGADGKVGIGTSSSSQMLTVAGKIYSTVGGFMFPDGSVQTRALPENLTGSKAVVTNGSGILTTANTTATEIGLLNGLMVSASTINQALSGISGNVTGGNLNTLVGGGNTTLHSHQLASGATDVSVSASALNQALYGISSSVTASNLNTITNGSTTTLHKHQLSTGATDVTASASEINQVTDGVSGNVTASNLNTLTGAGNATSLHYHNMGSSVVFGNGTRAKTAPNGTQSISCGFMPTYVKIYVTQTGTLSSDFPHPSSFGQASSATNQQAHYVKVKDDSGWGKYYTSLESGSVIYMMDDSEGGWKGTITSFDSQGFTLSWDNSINYRGGLDILFSYECYR